LLDEVEEVFGEVGFEGDDELLVVETEGVGGVEFDAWVHEADADVLVHEAFALGGGEEIPGAGLPEGVDEDVFLAAGTDGAATFAFALVLAVDGVLRALGHGEEAVGGGEVAAERGGEEFGAHAVELVECVADGPDAHVDVAAGADGGIGDGEEFAGLVPLGEDVGEGLLVGGFFVGGETTPLGVDFVEAEADDLALDRCGAVGGGRGVASGLGTCWGLSGGCGRCGDGFGHMLMLPVPRGRRGGARTAEVRTGGGRSRWGGIRLGVQGTRRILSSWPESNGEGGEQFGCFDSLGAQWQLAGVKKHWGVSFFFLASSNFA
jgi:hypothetical protein